MSGVIEGFFWRLARLTATLAIVREGLPMMCDGQRPPVLSEAHTLAATGDLADRVTLARGGEVKHADPHAGSLVPP